MYLIFLNRDIRQNKGLYHTINIRDSMTLTFIKKARKVSGMMIISIPKEIVDIGDIQEGDALEIKVKRLSKREKAIIKKEDKTIIPDTLKEAVKQALKLIQANEYIKQYDKEEFELLKNANDTKKRKGTGYKKGSLKFDMTDFWVSYSFILGTIRSNKLCDIDLIQSKNIYKDIGQVLEDFGFFELKRNASGTHRLINVITLKDLIEIDNTPEEGENYDPKGKIVSIKY